MNDYLDCDSNKNIVEKKEKQRNVHTKWTANDIKKLFLRAQK